MATEKPVSLMDEQEEAEEGSRRADPEVLAIGRIIRMLNELEEPARSRVISYLSARYACKDKT